MESNEPIKTIPYQFTAPLIQRNWGGKNPHSGWHLVVPPNLVRALNLKAGFLIMWQINGYLPVKVEEEKKK